MKLLRQLRELKGLTREELAKKANVRVRDIEDIENPNLYINYKPGMCPLPQIGGALDITPTLSEPFSMTEAEKFVENILFETKRLGGDVSAYPWVANLQKGATHGDKEKGTIDGSEEQGRESISSSFEGSGGSRRREVEEEKDVELQGPSRAAARYGGRQTRRPHG